jgi:MoaA/NifB/PqqE/SkfB family radical SAM enzyme
MSRHIKEILKKLIPQRVLQFRRAYKANKRLKIKKLLEFEIHVTTHCNLNCKSCSHFSPLQKEEFIDVDEFQRDCQRIAELSNGELKELRFLGGEPLLHKRIIDILRIARKYFPKADFIIFTNGILLPKQTEEFWKTCNKNHVRIHISKYPINLNRNEIDNLACKYNVKIRYDKVDWGRYELDVKGSQNIEESFRFCGLSNLCINLYKGKLYTCPIIPFIHILNNYFQQNFAVCDYDYIDIYKVKNIDEIFSFLCKPIPFCKYCNTGKYKRIEWGISKKDISEWI